MASCPFDFPMLNECIVRIDNNLSCGALNKVGPIAPPPTVPLPLPGYKSQYMTHQMGLIFLLLYYYSTIFMYNTKRHLYLRSP